MDYPYAERLALVEQLHGQSVADPYRWLEDASSEQTQQWQAAQDELWLAYAGSLPTRYAFRSRVKALSAVGSVSTPVWRGDHCFVVRREPRRDHPVLSVDGVELLDPAKLDPSGLTTLDSWQPSPDGSLVAFQISRGGSEQSVLHVLDVATGALAEEPIDGCRYSPIAWRPDGKSFYYVRFRQVLLHTVGGSDQRVLADEASYGLDLSADGRWLTISAAHGTTNDLWLADLRAGGAPQPLEVAGDAITLMSVGHDGRLYVVTTQDAPTGRICVGDPENPLVWHDYVPADPDAPLSSLAVLDKVVLVGRTRGTIGEIAIHDLVTGRYLGDVPLPGRGSVGSLTTRPIGGHEAWFSYTDSVTPSAVYSYDALTGETTVWSPAPGAAPAVEATATPVPFVSADGTELELLVITGPGSGPRPTILYGYGGFGQSLTPTYSAFALAWVEAGGVFVTATLRGGGERGHDWHRAGILDQKQNVIDDFLAAAEHLIAEGWTTPAQLAACGESNGGLLVGAAITQRPDLFAAAVCSAPLLDMARYELTGLGARWVPEFGSASDPLQLKTLLSYSPYHHVSAQDYPAVLFTTFANDTRVDPLHARKMCAALQHAGGAAASAPGATAPRRPVLLRVAPDAGHASGGAGQGVALAADMLAFLDRQLR